MKKLTQAAFQRAMAFVREQGRDLDRSLLTYYFEGGSAASVLAALASYQNYDGGFRTRSGTRSQDSGIVSHCDDRGVPELPVSSRPSRPSNGA